MARLGNAALTVAAGCAQYDALGGEASSLVIVTEPGRAGQGQGPAADDPGVVTWAGSLGVAGRGAAGALNSTGVAGRGALFSDPERPCQPCGWSCGQSCVPSSCCCALSAAAVWRMSDGKSYCGMDRKRKREKKLIVQSLQGQ